MKKRKAPGVGVWRGGGGLRLLVTHVRERQCGKKS